MAGPLTEVPSLLGRTLGHYRILEKIGEGGRGEVYRARDEHLDCDVAIKVLPPGSINDESARKRFHKEARALSRLSHPTIAIVHDFDTQQGVDYLVMEYIQGTTLSEKLARGKLPEKEVVRLGIQLAEGLCAAHEHGVIHSDLKPGNLRLTSDGRLKILDFGLAKFRFQVTATARTETLSAHGPGGTLPYMAPEQLLSGEIDARTDIHAAGCVLYEMATGRRPFAEVELSKLISAILNKPRLSPAVVNPAVSAELERIIGKCLEKEPENRYQSARELVIDLRRLQAATTSRLPETGFVQEEKRDRRHSFSRRILIALSGVVLVIVVFVAYWPISPLPPPKVLSVSQISNDGHDKFYYSANPLVTDGSRVYFMEADASPWGRISQVSATGGDTAAITDGFVLWDVSPVRSELLIGNNRADEPPIEILPLPAGARRRVGDLRGDSAAWSADGQRIVYVNGSGLYVARSDGTEPHKIVTVPGALAWPRWSPDGKRIRFTLVDAKTGSDTLWELRPDGTRLRPLLPGWNSSAADCCGNWTPDGKYFVFQSRRGQSINIWALQEGRSFFRRTVSAPVRLTSGPMNYSAPVVSRDGKRIFVKGAIPRCEVVRYDKKSGQFVPYLGGISAEGLDFSRDGQWLAYVTYPEGTLWRSKIDGRDRIQLTFFPLQATLPRWSPDGRRIAFTASVDGQRWHVYLVSAEGGRPRQMTRGEGNELDVDWSADGASLLVGDHGGQKPRIRVLNLTDLQLATFPGPEGLWSPRLSPDGHYLAAYVGQAKLMLYDFRTKKWIARPVADPDYSSWSRDGKYLYVDSHTPTGSSLVRLRVSDGRVEKVVDLKDLRRPFHAMFGRWSGLAPDDSPLLLRDTGIQEIYALDWEAP